MNQSGKSALYLVVLLLATIPGHSMAREIGHDEAVSFALQNSPALKGSLAGAQARAEQASIAEAARLPRIDLNYDALLTDNALAALGGKLNTRSVTPEDFQPDRLNNPGTESLFTTGLTVEVPLYTGGRLEAGIDEARSNSRAAELAHFRTRATIAYEVQRAYLYAQAARQAIDVAQTGTRAALQHVGTTRKLLAEGRIVKSDQLTAEVYHTSVSSAVETARSRYAQALNALKQVMGMDLAADITVPPMSDQQTPAAPPDAIVVEQEALVTRRDLQAAKAIVEAAEARLRRAEGAYRPELALVASGRLDADDPLTDESSWAVLARARINLYNGGSTRSQVSAARLDRDRLQAETESLTLAIRREVRDALAAIDEGQQRYRLADSNLETARRAVEQIDQRYGEGRTILIDLLQSEQALLKGREEWLNAQLRLRESQLALQHARGTLLPVELAEISQ